jgi:hypothetical protein
VEENTQYFLRPVSVNAGRAKEFAVIISRYKDTYVVPKGARKVKGVGLLKHR